MKKPISQTIRSSAGMSVSVLSRGAAIQSINVPTADGGFPAILTYDSTDLYETDPYYLGATVGPVANRIAGAAFTLDGIRYTLDANEADRGNCLHGGRNGLHAQHFELRKDDASQRIDCELRVPDGADGFPGDRCFRVRYEFVDDHSLAIHFVVTTDRATHINLANHAYFNLGGSLDEHRIRVPATTYTPVDAANIPNGNLESVANTDLDLRQWQRLGDRSIDHNFGLDRDSQTPQLAAQLHSPLSDLTLSVLTTQPGLQVYTGDFLSQPFEPRQGVCFEAQGFPDAPNQSAFPPTRLDTGSTFRATTIYRFDVPNLDNL